MSPERYAIREAIEATRLHMMEQDYALPKFKHLRKFIRGLVWNILERDKLMNELKRRPAK